MAVVAGVIFVLLRAGLALAPGLAERRPIKKWAAAAAFVGAAFYLVLSGAEVATQRAFIMTAIVLLGVMLDRQALTLRTLALSALAVMIVAPEAVVHPSFQMSFAATLALVAAYERGIPWIAAGGQTSLGARLALLGARELAALVFASLVAGLATTLFAAYHFHRLAPYGVLANLLAMPVVSAFVMPAGLLGLVALPFGFDGPVWRLMGVGIDWMTDVAMWIAGLPGAVGRIPAFGIVPLLVATLGLVVICLLRTPLRWSGAALIAFAAALAAATPRPDVFVAADSDAVAVRRADGRLAVLKASSQSFAPRDWLAADGDARAANDPDIANGFICDPAGCVARLVDGTIIAVARTAEAFADDCVRAKLVIARRDPPAALPPRSSIAACCAPRAHSRFAASERAGTSPRRGRPAMIGPGRGRRRNMRPSRGMPARRQLRRAMRRQPQRTSIRAIRPARSACMRNGTWINTAASARPACLGYGRGWAAGCAPRARCWRVRAQSRRRVGGTA